MTRWLFSLSLLVACAVVVPAAAQAQIRILDNNDCQTLGIPCTGSESQGGDIAERVYYFVDAGILLISTLATIYLLYAGYKYISSQGAPEAVSQAKRQMAYAGIGVVVAASAYLLRDAIVTTYQGSPGTAATNLIVVVDNFIALALFLVGTVATIFVIHGGYKYINSRGDYASIDAAKRQIVYAIIGIVVAAGARIISSAFIVPETGTLVGGRGGGDTLATLISGPINAVLTLVGIAAAAYIIMAGVMYFSSQGDEQRAETAKQQLIYGVVGIAIIVLAAAIVNFVIEAIA